MGTLLQAGKLENLKEKMRRSEMDVIGISEVRWEKSGELMSDEFITFYSDGDAKGNHGFGVVLGPRARDKVISVLSVDNRMMMVRYKGREEGTLCHHYGRLE